MPGFRDLRTPFVVGAIWIVAALLVIYPSRADVVGLPGIAAVTAVMGGFPPSVGLAAVGLAAYIVGTAAVGSMNWLLGSRLAVQAQRRWRSRDHFEDELRWNAATLKMSRRAIALTESAMVQRLRPVSSALADLAPRDLIVYEFELATLKLGHEAQAQYQQYDRLRAEAEFRTQLVVPLTVLVAVIAIGLTPRLGWSLLLAGLALVFVIGRRGAQVMMESSEFLATAIYLGYASTPMLDALVVEGEKVLGRELARSEGLDLAFLADFLVSRRLHAEMNTLLAKLRHPSRSSSGAFDDMKRFVAPSTLTYVERFEDGLSDEFPDEHLGW